MKKIGIIGSGHMALVRGKAFLDTGEAQIVGIASRNIEHAKRLADKLGAKEIFDDFHRLASLKPDALLIEVPHYIQGKIVKWGITVTRGILIGAVLAVNSKEAEEIERKAKEESCLIEAGYEARYADIWKKVKEIIRDKEIGEPVMVQSLALASPSPETWYYHEKESGGMPLTHMTYCFINPVRWILGPVVEVSASANQLLHKGEKFVKQQMCSATLRFQNDCLYSAVAGYGRPVGFSNSWWVKFICTNGAVEVFPNKNILKIYRKEGRREIDFSPKESSFLQQAKTFMNALDGKGNCLNPPEDAKIDVKIAEAIVRSTEIHKKVKL